MLLVRRITGSCNDPVVRRVEIRAEPYPILEHEPFGDRVPTLHDRDKPALRMLAIQKIQIALRPALERDEKDPPAVRRCRDAQDVLLGTPLAEDELIARGIGAQTVEADTPVVVLVAGGHGSRRGMNCVVEPAVAGYPRDRASLGLRDPVCESAIGPTSRTRGPARSSTLFRSAPDWRLGCASCSRSVFSPLRDR